MQIRHGDLLIVSIDSIPPKSSRQAHNVLAEGEATGHAHTIDANGILYEKDGNLYLDVPRAKASLTHQEHARIDIPRGTYRVVRQREYSPEAIRNVAD